MISNSTVSFDETSDITIKGKWYKGTKGLLELLTQNVNTNMITTSVLKRYNNILEVTNAH